MPLLIQRSPSGLLNYLKLRSQGELPDELSRNVVPMIDVGPNYDMDLHTAVREPINMSTGQIETFTVPSNEVWKLLSLAVQRDSLGTTNPLEFRFTFTVERGLQQGLDGVPIHTSPALTFPGGVGAAGRFAYAKWLERPFLLKPNQILAVQLQYGIDLTTSGAVNFVGDFWAHVVRVPV